MCSVLVNPLIARELLLNGAGASNHEKVKHSFFAEICLIITEKTYIVCLNKKFSRTLLRKFLAREKYLIML